MSAIKPLPPPYAPVPYGVPDICALQALERGDATPEQQQRAIAYFVNVLCDTYGFEYRTDSRDHAFASGRRFVGLQTVKLLKLNPAIFKDQ